MRAIFCGTPEIAVPSLNALAKIANIVGIVCQPDRPAGRGMKLRAPAVKIRALEMGIAPYQPEKVRDGTLSSWMKAQNADIALVIAYGRILGLDALSAPRLGCLNLHASLLPKYRGAAPIQRVILAGENETGVCLMKMDEGMDTGPILACHHLALTLNETSGTLAVKLSELAATVTRTEVPRYLAGELSEVPQETENATFAPPIDKRDCPLDFSRTAQALSQQIRGLAPRPGATCMIRRKDAQDRRLKILQASIAISGLDLASGLKPGLVRAEDGKLLVGTGSVPLVLTRGQLDGKKAQSSTELLNGRTLLTGDLLG